MEKDVKMLKEAIVAYLIVASKTCVEVLRKATEITIYSLS
jgi:hypothetical protein